MAISFEMAIDAMKERLRSQLDERDLWSVQEEPAESADSQPARGLLPGLGERHYVKEFDAQDREAAESMAAALRAARHGQRP